MLKETNILITSAGRRSYLVEYFKEALEGNGKVFVSNSMPFSPAFAVADEYVVTPQVYEENYIPFLLEYCRKKSIRAVISLLDLDLPVLAASRDAFSKIGVELLISSNDVIDIANDKYKTFQYLRENGISTPYTCVSMDEALLDIAEGKLDYPLMVKPRWGCGSILIYEAGNEDELKVFYNKIKRDIQATYLKYESSRDKENCVIIQKKLRGQEYGLDIINDLNGAYCNTIVKMKYAMRAGETDCAQITAGRDFEKTGERLSHLLHHTGNLDVDVIRDRDGSINVLDINARFGGGYPFSHAAGVNLPKQIVLWLNGEATDMSLLRATPGIMFHKDLRIVKLESESL